jgi:hypothetical protein
MVRVGVDLGPHPRPDSKVSEAGADERQRTVAAVKDTGVGRVDLDDLGTTFGDRLTE